jgi:hypothetical protein
VKTVTTTPDVPLARSVTFAAPDPETLKAGLSPVTEVTFTTTVGIPTATDKVTLARTVPAIWKDFHVTTLASPLSGYTLDDGDVYPGHTSVRLDVNTNIQWWAQRLPDPTWAKVYSVVPTAYNAPLLPNNNVRIIEVPVSERPPLDPDSWTTDTTVHLLAGHDDIPAYGIDAHEKSDIPSLVRPRHKLEVTAIPAGNLDNVGGTMYVTFRSTASKYDIQLQAGTTTWNPTKNVGGVQTISGNGAQPVTYEAIPSATFGVGRSLYVFNAFTQELLAGPIPQKANPEYRVLSVTAEHSGTTAYFSPDCPAGFELVTDILPSGTILYGVPSSSYSSTPPFSLTIEYGTSKATVYYRAYRTQQPSDYVRLGTLYYTSRSMEVNYGDAIYDILCVKE